MISGQKLAHYEILASIGRGGMGEVYRAKDAKLGRDVAIDRHLVPGRELKARYAFEDLWEALHGPP